MKQVTVGEDDERLNDTQPATVAEASGRWVTAQLYLPCNRCDGERPFVPRGYHLSSSPQAVVTYCELGHVVIVTESVTTAGDIQEIRQALVDGIMEPIRPA